MSYFLKEREEGQEEQRKGGEREKEGRLLLPSLHNGVCRHLLKFALYIQLHFTLGK
jgi:hypothetical protein